MFLKNSYTFVFTCYFMLRVNLALHLFPPPTKTQESKSRSGPMRVWQKWSWRPPFFLFNFRSVPRSRNSQGKTSVGTFLKSGRDSFNKWRTRTSKNLFSLPFLLWMLLLLLLSPSSHAPSLLVIYRHRYMSFIASSHSTSRVSATTRDGFKFRPSVPASA